MLFYKINIANNKRCKKVHTDLNIELMQWQAYSLKGSSFDNNKNIALPRKNNLKNFAKM